MAPLSFVNKPKIYQNLVKKILFFYQIYCFLAVTFEPEILESKSRLKTLALALGAQSLMTA